MALNLKLRRGARVSYEAQEARRKQVSRELTLARRRREEAFEHMARHLHTCRECGRAYGPCLCSLPDFHSLCLACDSGERWLLGLLDEADKADQEGGSDG